VRPGLLNLSRALSTALSLNPRMNLFNDDLAPAGVLRLNTVHKPTVSLDLQKQRLVRFFPLIRLKPERVNALGACAKPNSKPILAAFLCPPPPSG